MYIIHSTDSSSLHVTDTNCHLSHYISPFWNPEICFGSLIQLSLLIFSDMMMWGALNYNRLCNQSHKHCFWKTTRNAHHPRSKGLWRILKFPPYWHLVRFCIDRKVLDLKSILRVKKNDAPDTCKSLAKNTTCSFRAGLEIKYHVYHVH